MFDSSIVDTGEMPSICFPEFSPGVDMIGCLNERFFEELTEFLHLRIA
jgi:hypothetical protein